MSTEQNESSLRQLVEEAWNKGNLSIVDEITAPDVVLHFLPPDMPTGAESLRRMIVLIRTAFPDLHITIEDQVAEGDRVAVRLIMTGTHLGPFYNNSKVPTPPTGKRFRMEGMDIWRFDDNGKWVECWSTYDRLAQLQQLGALPVAAPSAS